MSTQGAPPGRREGPTQQHVPADGGIFLDHLAHWVEDMEAASRVFQAMGFVLTPRTQHSHSPAPGAPLEPAGSANRCIMLGQGYLEILTPTADTPIARELRAGIARYPGLHLAAFCVADANAERERLVGSGFPQRPSVTLERATRNDKGAPQTLRFTVIRPQPGALAEGRVQFLTHHTPQLMWTPALSTHPNGVCALTDLLFCVADPHEAAERYQRYLRTAATPVTGGVRIDLARGSLTLLDPGRCAGTLGKTPPAVPCMAAYGLRCTSLAATGRFLVDAGFELSDGPGRSRLLHLPDPVGGSIALHAQPAIAWS